MKRKDKVILHQSLRLHPPPPGPPPIDDVIAAIQKQPSLRTPEQNQILFRHLLFNREIAKYLENTKRIEECAREISVVKLNKGDVLFVEGDDPDGWFIVLSGYVDVIIRIYLIAENCIVDNIKNESTEFAQLAEQMNLDPSIDQLKRVNILQPGSIFGQHSYILENKRAATVVARDYNTYLIRLPDQLFQTATMIILKNMYLDTYDLIKSTFPRLRAEQCSLLAAYSRPLALDEKFVISEQKPFGKYLYLIKKGTISRLKVIDFTTLSFRYLKAPFESLDLHFPNGLYPVHTNDLTTGAIFFDPCLSDLCDSSFIMKAKNDCELIAIDIEYFEIVAGSFELVRVKTDLQDPFTEEQVINIWIERERQKLWKKFKINTRDYSHSEKDGEKQFRNSTTALRTAGKPISLPCYLPHRVVPYAPPRLRA